MNSLSLGPRLRSRLGRYEKPVVELYRRVYINLDNFSENIGNRINANGILEVGCGEGMLTARLHKVFPKAMIIGIDISSRVGRLFPDAPGNILFFNGTAQSIELEYKKFFDLVVICDVLHHVPPQHIPSLLQSVGRMLKPEGIIFIKEWQKKYNLIHLLGYASDRWITGDRVVYFRKAELRKLIENFFGQNAIIEEFSVPPWSNNVAFQIRPEWKSL